MPEIEHIGNKINYNQIRAIADSGSLKLRFSDTKTFETFEPEEAFQRNYIKLLKKLDMKN